MQQTLRKWIGYAVLIGFVPSLVHAQTKPKNNGYNLEHLCGYDDCKYLAFEDEWHYPQESGAELVIHNLEMILKPSGVFLVTGDFNIAPADSAMVIQLTFEFNNEIDQPVYIHSTEEFEFFNEPGNAEPMAFSGKLPEGQEDYVVGFTADVHHAEVKSGYNIQSDCYHPCKIAAFKVKMKAFKKAK